MRNWKEKYFPEINSIVTKNVTKLIKKLKTTEVKKYHNQNYYNIPACFDSETTAIKNTKGETIACYDVLWQIAIDNIALFVTDGVQCVKALRKISSASCGKKLIIYCHNLDYDFSFLCNYLSKEDITDYFIIRNKISKIILWENIEIRDSLMLTGGSLDKAVIEFLGKDSIFRKKYGSWDYEKIRSRKWDYSDNEIVYAAYDVFALNAVIAKISNIYHCSIAALAVTRTSFIAREIKNLKRKSEYFNSYIYATNLTIDELRTAKASYYGGVAMVNPVYADILKLGDVTSWDIGSEYPWAMVSQLFPTGKIYHMEKASLEDLQTLCAYTDKTQKERYGFCAVMQLTDFRTKKEVPIPFSFSRDGIIRKSVYAEDETYAGGRIVTASKLITYINDVDLQIVLKSSHFTSIKFVKIMYYKMRPLPTVWVESILTDYAKKTTLKGLPDKADEYTRSKININIQYGKQAQYPIMSEYKLDSFFECQKLTQEEKGKTLEEELADYNTAKGRISNYLIAVYIASYGHAALYHGITFLGKDVILTDTDSVKGINGKQHEHKFTDYNRENENRLRFIGKYWHGWNDEKINNLYFPKTQKGEIKPIGNYESENYNSAGLPLRGIIAKRPKCYILFYTDGINLDIKYTVAGIAKSAIKDYIMEQDTSASANQSILFHAAKFVENYTIPADKTRKLTKKRVIDQQPIRFKDAQNNWDDITNKSAIYLDPCTFALDGMAVDEMARLYLKGELNIDDSYLF